MNRIWWWVIALVGIAVFSSVLLPSAAQEDTNNVSSEAINDHGTSGGATFLPSEALDSKEIPNLIIKPEDEGLPLPVYEVAKNTYLFFGNIAEVDKYNRGSNANAGFVVTSEGVIVIDSLGSPLLGRRLIATVKEKTDLPIRYLILTHNHPDHAYGYSAFAEIPDIEIIGSEGMLEYINSSRLDSSVEYRNTFIAQDMKGFSLLPPTMLIAADSLTPLSISLGEVSMDIYEIGNVHSDGDLVIYQKNEDILWVSDLVFNQRVTFIADGHSRSILEAQAWLLETFPDARKMIPGHGSAQSKPFPMLARTGEYIQRLRDEMGAAVEDDVELQEAVNAGDFPEWKGERMYDLNHRKNLNFVYTEMEEELF